MIRHDFDLEKVRTAIDTRYPGWLKSADRKTKKFMTALQYNEKKGSWSKVKSYFAELQHNKCAYCERPLSGDKTGLVEYDVEHFRPKKNTPRWPDPVRQPKLHYDFETGAEFGNGYYWLAYDIRNYSVACKECNTSFKLDWFPIMAARGTAFADVDALEAEKPFLCYPMGQRDIDPEQLLGFSATVAVPVAQDAEKRRRAEVIIDFFGLNTRQTLHEQRAQFIVLLGGSLERLRSDPARDGDKAVVDALTSTFKPHANCLRSYKRLWDQDRKTGLKIFEACLELIARTGEVV